VAAQERLKALDGIVKAMRNVDQDSSMALAKRLLREAREQNDTLMTALAYRDLGIAELMVRSNDPALAYLDKSLHWYGLKQDSTFRVGSGAVLSTMAMAHKNAGRLDTAMAFYRRSMAMHRSANDLRGLVFCYNGMGRVREIKGENDSALADYGKVVELASQVGLDEMESSGYGNLGNVYASMGRIGEAIDMTYRSLAIAERIGDVRGTAACLTTVSSLKASLGDRQNALALLHKALGKYRQVDYRQGEMTASSSIGEMLLLMGRPDSAIIMLESALALERAADAKDLMGNTLRRLGEAYRNVSRPADARRLLNEAAELARDLGDNPGESIAFALIGKVDLDQGNARAALDRCTKGLALALPNAATAERRENCECLYLANKALGNGMAALKNYETFISTRDSLSNAQSRDELTRRDLLYDFSKQQLADSMRHSAERAQLEGARTIETLRADQNRNRALATGAGAVLLLGGIGAWAVSDRRRRHERFEKEAATLETQALRSQMNPHFIFNALNSINGFVQRNDQDSASSYLSKFARLMRLVLENSRHAEVPLSEDLEALRGYMELERMRMDEKFDFSIELGPGIDPDTLLVPPLVVQPFVENAIWHGMTGKDGKGHIRLAIEMRATTLLWTIEDDGGGRKAKKPATDGPVKKTSLGTAITRARLDLVGKQHGSPAGFRYTDLEQGTRVEVEMPLLEG
jgi:tetratricopeptide (TPR) repeat protein